MLLQNKVAIVTGATRGIGKAILYRLAEEGATVIGVYNSSVQAATNIQNDLLEKGHSAILHQGSVTDKEFVHKLADTTISNYGKIDILVNNAGITRDNIIFNMPEKDWNNVFETNFRGTVSCVRWQFSLIWKIEAMEVLSMWLRLLVYLVEKRRAITVLQKEQ